MYVYFFNYRKKQQKKPQVISDNSEEFSYFIMQIYVVCTH